MLGVQSLNLQQEKALAEFLSGSDVFVNLLYDFQRLSATIRLLKCFQNFCQSCVLSTDQIEIHQSQPLVWPSDLLYVMLAGCDWWISIRRLGFVYTLLRQRSRVKSRKLPHLTWRHRTALSPSAFRHLSPETWREEEAAEIQAKWQTS